MYLNIMRVFFLCVCVWVFFISGVKGSHSWMLYITTSYCSVKGLATPESKRSWCPHGGRCGLTHSWCSRNMRGYEGGFSHPTAQMHVLGTENLPTSPLFVKSQKRANSFRSSLWASSTHFTPKMRTSKLAFRNERFWVEKAKRDLWTGKRDAKVLSFSHCKMTLRAHISACVWLWGADSRNRPPPNA